MLTHRRPVADTGRDSEQFRRELSSWMLGTVLGYAMCLRGLPTLHGSVVEIDGRAVALLGASGAGKSTLAGALVAAGHAMLADDHLVVRRADGGPGERQVVRAAGTAAAAPVAHAA